MTPSLQQGSWWERSGGAWDLGPEPSASVGWKAGRSRVRGTRQEGSGRLSPGLPGKWPPFLNHCQLEVGAGSHACPTAHGQLLISGWGKAEETLPCSLGDKTGATLPARDLELSQASLQGCFVWKGLPIFPSHLRMRPVSRGNWRCSLVGGATCRTPPMPRSALEKDPRPGPLLEGNPVGEGTTRRGTATPVRRPQRPAGSTHSSTRGLRPPEQLERPAATRLHLQFPRETGLILRCNGKIGNPFQTKQENRHSRPSPVRLG